MTFSRQRFFPLVAVVTLAACLPAGAALREANGSAARIEVEYLLPLAGSSTSASGSVGNFGTMHWTGRRSSSPGGAGESTSEVSAALFAESNQTSPPTGDVTISGAATEGKILTATNTLADANGLGAITYQWYRDGVPIFLEGTLKDGVDLSLIHI